MNFKDSFIVIFVSSFYSFLFIYLRKAKILPLNPSVFFVLFTALGVLFILFSSKRKIFFKNKTNLWILFYFSIIILWSIFPSSKISTIKELAMRLYTPFVLISFNILVVLDDFKASVIRKTIVVVVYFSIFMNIYEFFYPTSLKFEKYKSLIGRSAGLYTNPNVSAISIIIGVIVTITILSNKHRIVLILFSFIGVFLTFSRGGIIVWSIMFMLMFYFNFIKIKGSIFYLSLFIITITLTLPSISNYMTKDMPGHSNITNRLNWFSSVGKKSDRSEKLRIYVAKKAINNFKENPIFGKGIGTSLATRKENIEAHNIYLQLASQFGVIGFLIFLLLLLLSIYDAKGEVKKVGYIFFLSLLFWGMVSHNIMDKYFFLISVSLMGYLSYQSDSLKLRGDNIET